MNTRAYLFGISLITSIAQAAMPAFPGAEGAGAMATGGRGGEVFIVTNTNADGPGSLADAVSQPNRVIVFSTSGVIDLASGKGQDAKGGRFVIKQSGITADEFRQAL